MICCYVYDGMADFEITLLMHRLKNTGKRQCVYISEDTKPIQAQSGLTFVPDQTIASVDMSEIEALIIPGGPINNTQNSICNLVTRLAEKGTLVAAICFAPQFLGRAGILNQYTYTTSCSEDKIKQLQVEDPFNREQYRHQRVVIDRNVITAQGFAFVDFAMAVCNYLGIYEGNEERFHQELERVKSNELV